MKKTTKGRPILLLLLIFCAPLALAFWLYYGLHWHPALRTNHGTLIQPVVSLPALAVGHDPANVLTGKWSLLVVGEGPSGCDDSCRVSLAYARQTWLSLGKFTTRVRRVLLAADGCCDENFLRTEHPGLVVARTADPGASRVLAALPLPVDHTIYVVDPLGNLMMRYDVRQDPKGLREDLQNLLELSNIG